MEPKLKTFEVVFDFGNNEIHSTIDAESHADAQFKIKELLSEGWPLADFNNMLINHKLLQAVQIRELEEQDDTI